MGNQPTTQDNIRAAKQIKAAKEVDFTASGVVVTITHLGGGTLVEGFTVLEQVGVSDLIRTVDKLNQICLISNKSTLSYELKQLSEVIK